MIANGRGGGFHQFSGLSTPVLMWFNAYYKPYTVTSGFMTVISSKRINKNLVKFDVKSTAKRPVILICLPENESYAVKTTGKVFSNRGIYTIEFDGPVAERIEIIKK